MQKFRVQNQNVDSALEGGVDFDLFDLTWHSPVKQIFLRPVLLVDCIILIISVSLDRSRDF